jgi:hypothetical protein
MAFFAAGNLVPINATRIEINSFLDQSGEHFATDILPNFFVIDSLANEYKITAVFFPTAVSVILDVSPVGHNNSPQVGAAAILEKSEQGLFFITPANSIGISQLLYAQILNKNFETNPNIEWVENNW